MSGSNEMRSKRMFFVAGITGRVGGATARRLLQEGRKLRALAREPDRAEEWRRLGVEVRRGDFDDPAAVADALQGVEGAFLMLPPILTPAPDFAEARATIGSFREALRRSPPRRLVVLSSIGSQRASGLGLITGTRLLEQALADAPFPTAFVRAASFVENAARSLEAAAASGWFDSFRAPTDRATPTVATTDIGAEVARLLIAEWNGKRVIELGSPASPDDIARAMSEATGRPVRARAIPREQWSATLIAHGFPPGATWACEQMEDGFNSGWIAFGDPGAEPVAATTPPAEVFANVWRGRASAR